VQASGRGKTLAASSMFTQEWQRRCAARALIPGPHTQMDWAYALTIDPERNELFRRNDGGNRFCVSDARANGDVAPSGSEGAQKPASQIQPAVSR